MSETNNEGTTVLKKGELAQPAPQNLTANAVYNKYYKGKSLEFRDFVTKLNELYVRSKTSLTANIWLKDMIEKYEKKTRKKEFLQYVGSLINLNQMGAAALGITEKLASEQLSNTDAADLPDDGDPEAKTKILGMRPLVFGGVVIAVVVASYFGWKYLMKNKK